MPQPELENLVRARAIRAEPMSTPEFEGLVRSAEARLKDAVNPANSVGSENLRLGAVR